MSTVKDPTRQSHNSKAERFSPAYLAFRPALLLGLTLCLALLYLYFLGGIGHLANGIIFTFAAVAMFYVFLLPYFEDVSKALQHLHTGVNLPQAPPKLSGAIPELSGELHNITNNFRSQFNKLETALMEASSILNAIPAMVVALDADLKIVNANDLAKERLGDDIVNQDVALVFSNVELARGITYALRTGQPYKFSAVNNVEPQGIYDIQINPINLTSVGKQMALVFICDTNDARRSDEVITDFIANISHEIRTPLTSIVGAIDVLEYTNWDVGAVREFMPVIRTQTDRMCALANQLITLLNIERTQYGYDFIDVSVSELLDLVLKQLTSDDCQADITVATEGIDTLPTVYGNPWELEHALYQIIQNAVMHSGSQKVIISAGTTQIKGSDMVYISVSDEGVGIPGEHIDRIMEKFYRIDASRSRKAGGNGLGLAIVREIILKHRGSISIKNREIGGVTFTIYLPYIILANQNADYNFSSYSRN